MPSRVEATVESVTVVEGGVTRLANSGRLRPVDEDSEEPRLHRATALEAMDSFDHTQPCVLYDLFRYSTCRHERLGQAQHAHLVPADQGGERLLVPVAQRGE